MRFHSLLLYALRRLWANKALTLCSLAGLTVVVMIMSSIPLYADAAKSSAA